MEEINDLIDFALYPPYENRGFGPLAAIHYGIDDVEEYVTKEHLEICRFIQIEHMNVVEKL